MRVDRLKWILTRPVRRAQIYSRSVRARSRRRRQVHMLHVGKTGGTAVKHALRRRPPTDPRIEIVMHHHDVTLGDLPPWDDVFVVLRDPVARFVSAFNSRQRQGRPRHDVAWSPAERRCFTRFATPDDLGRALDDDDPLLRREARRAMRSVRHISWPYRRWLGSRRRVRARRSHILLVGHQENLSADFERLKSALALPADARLPSREKAAHRAPAGADTRLSDRAQANLAAWYRDDYDLLAFLDRELG